MKIKEKVLLIEDERTIRGFMQAILTANGYDVLMAGTGAMANTMISSHCPDLIILDLGLPDMDGMTILRSVREWSKVPILVVPARSHERDKVEALDAGALVRRRDKRALQMDTEYPRAVLGRLLAVRLNRLHRVQNIFSALRHGRGKEGSRPLSRNRFRDRFKRLSRTVHGVRAARARIRTALHPRMVRLPHRAPRASAADAVLRIRSILR